jgi:hypothetical protein
MVLHALCHVCTFSLHRESPDKILGDERVLLQGWFCHRGGSSWREQHRVAGGRWCQWGSATAARQGRLQMGLARYSHYHFLFIQMFFNPFKFKMVKYGHILLQEFQEKCGHVEKWIRNNSPHWSFSKFRIEFELKFREPIWDKFDWIWNLGTWKLRNLMQFGMRGPNWT